MRKFNSDLKRDFLFSQKRLNYEYNNVFNRSIYNEFQCIPSFTYSFYKRYYLKNINYASKLRLRCVFTGRVRGTVSFFMMSRMFFKKFALNGLFIGVKKASW